MLVDPSPGMADSLLDSRGDSAFFSSQSRPLAKFPTLESLVPMPLNINPFNRQRVRVRCVLQVIKRSAPVRGAKGRFAARLVLMDNAAGTFHSTEMTSGKFKSDADGQVIFTFDVPTDMFAQGFRNGEISAWSHASVVFSKRKATYALLRCDVTARK